LKVFICEKASIILLLKLLDILRVFEVLEVLFIKNNMYGNLFHTYNRLT